MLTHEKHYAATIDLEVSFINRLQSGETLASSPVASVQTANDGVVGDLTLAAPTITTPKVIVRASAGKCHEKVSEQPPRWETRYTIKVAVTTSSGEIESELVELVVYDSVERS